MNLEILLIINIIIGIAIIIILMLKKNNSTDINYDKIRLILEENNNTSNTKISNAINEQSSKLVDNQNSFKSEVSDKLARNSKELLQYQSNTLQGMTNSLNKNFEKVNEILNTKLYQMNSDISTQIKTNYEKQLESQSKTTQDMIQSLNDKFVNVNDLLSNKLTEINDNFATTSRKQLESQTKAMSDVTESLNKNFTNINVLLSNKLLEITKEMNDKINKNFEKTNTSFTSMIERLSKIDEAQKKIESLSTNIISLQDILTDKKTRGIYGEIQLNNILKSVFGDPGQLYDIQHKLSNGTLVDAFIQVPEPVGNIPIDSKFPLENYQRMVDDSLPVDQRNQAAASFKKDLKKHIDDISGKYIIKDETAQNAIMFLPAEAIFAYVNAYFQDIIEYAAKKHVWIASPTTLMATLSSIQMLLRNMKASEYTKQIHFHLNKLKEEFVRYEKRWDKLSSSIDKVSGEVKDITTTTGKISRQFNNITALDFEEKEGDLIE